MIEEPRPLNVDSPFRLPQLAVRRADDAAASCRRREGRARSKGFGRVWAEAALARGDRVAATARNVKALAPLVERYGDQVAALTLDVTSKVAAFEAVARAHSSR